MEISKTTSKTGSLKALILRAWRERWNDVQWGINLKTILPRGVSGDVYNLAEVMIQLATIGLTANELIISYLRHTLSCQVVTYSAVLTRLSKYTEFDKPYCIVTLLEFLEELQDGITCRNKSEEPTLAGAIFSIVNWLLNVYNNSLAQVPLDSDIEIEYPELLEKPATILSNLLKSDFIIAMLTLAKFDDLEILLDDVKIEVAKTSISIISLLDKHSDLETSNLMRESIEVLCNLSVDPVVHECTEEITYCVQALFAVEVTLHPSTDAQTFVTLLNLIQRLKGYSNSRLYCELIRASFIALNEANDTSRESIWGAITYLKVPEIIEHMHFGRGYNDSLEYSKDLVEGLELLLMHPALLDNMDTRCSCNSLECLLNEMVKRKLLTESHATTFINRRDPIIETLKSLEATHAASIPKMIIRAEPTLAGILKTLNADYVKIQDALLSMLCQVLTGKSFELILAVATVQGKLKLFVSKLIKFNEASKQLNGESGKSNVTKTLLFDVSFVMLCYIVQNFGADVVLDGNGESFFEQWVRVSMVERGRPKSAEQMIQHCDPSKVELLLHQFHSGEQDFKNSSMKWSDVCMNISGAMKEVLWAWEQGSLSATDVRKILDAMRGRMCSLSVCAAAWICSYMQIVHQDALLKPMNMVQQLMSVLNNEELPQNDNYKERSGLMVQVVRKMQYDVHPPTVSKIKVLNMSHSIISKQPIAEQLSNVLAAMQRKGWLQIEATNVLDSLLNTGGPTWFVNNLVKEILKQRYEENLNKAVDFTFALFNLKIEQCTLALLQNVLPQLLHNKLQSEDLVQPQASALAKLTVFSILAALEFSCHNVMRRKRTRKLSDNEDIETMCPASKVRKLNDNSSESLFTGSLGLAPKSPAIILKDPLHSALKGLFDTFSILVEDLEVTQQMHFIFNFLTYLVECGKDRSQIILQLMPSGVMSGLIRAFPELFTTSMVMQLYDLTTASGRKSATRDLFLLRNIKMRAHGII